SVTSVLIGASKPTQLEDNLGAVGVRLTADDVAELDAATPLAPVYPNWFIDRMSDEPTDQALS
ncbi:MAG TPA: aldo/keto reductase, partial [Pseudonocardiaceae bacterium]|nr:aldo/keto reductase [Pseudonocardiaceae bacterium]